MDLGFAIRDRRRKLGLDQAELAQRVGASRKWVVDVEKGKPRAEIGLLLRAFDALGLRLSIDADGKAAADKIAGSAAIPVVDLDRLLDDVRARQR
jgi:HTH-type transcriptional regulator/antitoxin HipB